MVNRERSKTVEYMGLLEVMTDPLIKFPINNSSHNLKHSDYSQTKLPLIQTYTTVCHCKVVDPHNSTEVTIQYIYIG